MEQQYLARIIGISLLIGMLATLVFYVMPHRRSHYQQNPETAEQCYYYLQATSHEAFDFAWLRITTTAQGVTGAYYNYPGEKDSKTGTFVGALLKDIPHMADVVWDTRAEGMSAFEQLHISFDANKANAWFGIMKEGVGGHYVYAHPEQLTPGFIMNRVTCDQLEQVIATRGPKL